MQNLCGGAFCYSAPGRFQMQNNRRLLPGAVKEILLLQLYGIYAMIVYTEYTNRSIYYSVKDDYNSQIMHSYRNRI